MKCVNEALLSINFLDNYLSPIINNFVHPILYIIYILIIGALFLSYSFLL